MKQLYVLLVFLLSISFSHSQCVTNVNFSNWQQGGQLSNGNWELQSGGSQVHQTINGNPTFFYTPFDMMNVHISGEFRSTDFDDDYMGFVFSFLNPLTATDSFDCWLFDWKQANQGGAPQGMSLNRINGVVPPASYNPQFWDHQNSPAFTVVRNNFGSSGWSTFTWHDFDLYLTYTNARIYIDGNLIFDVDDCFKPGRFGFYNLSQQDCYYRNFQYEVYVDFQFASNRVCLGDTARLEFLNPCVPTFLNQYQTVTWDFGDGTSQVINNPTFATINTTHVYTTPGNYTARLTVLDFNGCTSSATQTVDVRTPIALSPTLVQPLCNGGSNGSVGVTATNGFGGYTYSWNGGASSTATYSGVSAGTYTVYVTDGSCTASAQYTLNQPTALSATTSHVDAPCGGTGTVSMTISGGTPPYVGVNWAGTPGTTASFTPGTYIADFRDQNGCSALLQYRETITGLPCGVTTSRVVNNVTCFGLSNGSATVTVNGGSPPSSITWSTGAVGPTLSNVPAGTYTYTYTDQVPGNTFSGTIIITQPGAAVQAGLTTIGISCSGANNGQAIASVLSGGTPPYNYAWSPASANNPVASNLAPGPVSVTVTDFTGCTATASGTISAVPSLNLSFTTVMDSCYHAGRGSATVNVVGGTPPYQYNWNNFQTDSLNDGIIEGNYVVTVTDNNNCTVSGSATVPGPSQPLSYSYTIQHVTCFGASTGNFNITPTGGTPGYSFQWNPSSVSGNNPTNLAAGIYNYTITDAYSCTVIGGDTIEQPATGMTVTTSHTDARCNGSSDGTITVNISGGVGPYTYQGNTVPPGATTIPGLPAGVYGGVVTDGNGCSVTVSDTINQPGPQSVTVTGVDNPCFGVSLGSATANFVNSTGTVGYSWSGGQTGATINNLAAGTYAVTGTDGNGCTATGSVTINQPAQAIMTVAVTDAACAGANGSATANPSGGTSPFTYNWSSGTGGQTIALPAGSYTVTATDFVGCFQTASFTINQPTGTSVQITTTAVNCFGGNDGAATITASAGAGAPYTFTWSPNVSSGGTASGLTAGTYFVTVFDAANCPLDTQLTISQPSAALTDSLVVANIACFGQTNGSISVITTGGTSPYNYTWSPAVAAGSNATNLAAGNYSVTVADLNGCSLVETATITEPTQLTVTSSQVDLVCFGAGNGSATVTPAGGTGAYSYTWTPNVGNTSTVTSLAAGAYSVVVTDASGCTATAAYTITEPTQFTLSETHTNLTCFGSNNGSVRVTAGGGTPGYTYQWNPSVSTVDSAINIAAGTYTITATDASACTVTVSATVTEPARIIVTPTSTNVTCFGLNDGTINVSATGGTLPYTYAITSDGVNYQTSANGAYNGLSPATYTVLVTDLNQCADSTTVNITEPIALNATVAVTDVSCNGYTDGIVTVNATGGNPGYTFNISGGGQNNTGLFSGLGAGSYSVTVTDLNGCTTTQSASLIEPDSVTLTVTPNPVEVRLGETVQLQTSTTQTGVVNYQWEPAYGLSCYDCASPAFSGNYSAVYTVNMSNQSGCTGTTTVTINVIPEYDIFIPNVFTPNGDGANDFWQIFGNLKGVKQLQVQVFNRWGEKVFDTTDINFEWDGTYKGKDAPIGVYTYVASFVWMNNHSDSNYKGTVTLMR